MSVNFSGLERASLLGRLARLPLRLIPPSAILPIIQGPLRGKRWIAGSGNHGCWLGSYEYGKQAALARALQRGMAVYDLGAHVGFYTLLASVLIGPEGHVYAFEPHPRNCALLRRHVSINRAENVTIFEAAVAAVEGEGGFDDAEDHSMGRLVGAGSLRVRTVSLDSLVHRGELRPPDLLKVDVEGAEAEVLSGAHEVLRRFRPLIFLATHGREVHERCWHLLSQQGYTIEALGGCSADELIARPQTGALCQAS